MKFLEKVAKVVASVWNFLATTFAICLGASYIIIAIALFMPENARDVVEIILNIFQR